MSAVKLAELKKKALDKEVVKFEAALAVNPADPVKVEQLWKVVDSKTSSLIEAQHKVLEHWLAASQDDEYLSAEEDLSKYQVEYDSLSRRMGTYMEKQFPEPVQVLDTTAKVNLPPVPLQKFSGNVREYLMFWASFEDIHNSTRLTDGEKFQYLLQCIPPNTPARKVIGEVPVNGKNYKEAVEALTRNFGRPTTLVKVYVRDLLDLVAKKTQNKSRSDIVEFVPQLVSHIRNLGELGVTSDKCESILYPVVEACLPDHILEAWQRSADYDESLDAIVKFLNREVQNSLERSLAQMTFSSTDSHKEEKKSVKKQAKSEVATASALVGMTKESENPQRNCIFCDKSGHKSLSCKKARKMPVSQRRAILKEKRACYICLRTDHTAGNCSSNRNCANCNGKHSELMCESNPPEVKRMMMVPATYQQGPGQYQQQYGYMIPGMPPPYQFQPQLTYHQDQSLQYSHPVAAPQPQQQPLVTFPPEHPPQQQPTPPVQQLMWKSDSEKPQGSLSVQQLGSYCNINGRKPIALMTMLACVESPDHLVKVRVFIDDGSEESYILDSVASETKCEVVGQITMQHQVFMGDVTKPKLHNRYAVKLWNVYGTAWGKYVFNGVHPRICHEIPKPAPGILMDEILKKGVKLHDQSMMTDEIQILIGMDVASQIWTGGFQRIDRYVVAKETIFGWVIGGIQPHEEKDGMNIARTHMVTTMLLGQLNEQDLGVWSLEAIGITDEPKNQSRKDMEDAALAHYEQTVTRLPTGRYECRLPWIEGHQDLKSNHSQAVARLKNLTRDLHRDNLYAAYIEIFASYKADKIIEEVPLESPGIGYFLPHRHVLKESSTTPVRPVFDASSKVRGSPSLNECLEKGPNNLELIPALAARFRLKKIAVVADIRKAFLQVSMHPDDRHLLRFLWWRDSSCKELVTYQFTRVVFGVTSSPFLLAATIRHHILNHVKDPVAAENLLKTFYVDNVVSSHDSLLEAEAFRKMSTDLLATAQMDLRGWEIGPSSEDKVVGVLGMSWNHKADTISLALEGTLKKLNGEMTKRGLLSVTNAVFDPMGYVQPFTLLAKLLFQKCCDQKELKWDDPLPSDIAENFQKWKDQVPALSKVVIPRHMCKVMQVKCYELHMFCDASGAAFATSAFLRSESVTGEVDVSLVMCRSRVAPSKKKITIPRLELLGCLLGVRLAKELKEYMKIADLAVTFWTDSSTAYTWIVRDKPWDRWVMNRVKEIRQLSSSSQWRHVPGEDNPADLPSRGCSVAKLLKLQWWEGPEWLRKSNEYWPTSTVNVNEAEVNAELKKSVVSASNTVKRDIMHGLFASKSFPDLVRLVSYWTRYLEKLKRNVAVRKNGGELQIVESCNTARRSSVEELEQAEKAILRYVQRISFNGPEDHKLRKLCAFTDESGLIRMKSQLYFGANEYDTRCPVVLPPDNVIVKQLVQHEHSSNSHAGIQTTLAILRFKYWILRGRRLVGNVITSCLKCRRFVAKRCDAPSVPLPADRVNCVAAFAVTGVDLLGPLILFGGDKVWVVLYTCAVYRCVHLEVTPTLSTEGFMNTFRRFVARRGRPMRVYSDNGCNFIGTNNLFKRVNWKEVQKYAEVQRIKWILNPPTAAWSSGFWERLVGLVKKLLRRVLGKSVVGLEELTTILCDVESTLNQRPLTYLTEQDKLAPLVPAYFLRDLSTGDLSEADAVDATLLRHSARRCQELRECLRRRFRSEYLGELQFHYKKKNVGVTVGDVVIIEHDNKKRIDWQRGVVKEVYPGRDGIVRTALVKTPDGELLRPLQLLFIMEAVSPGEEEKAEHPEEKVTRSGRISKAPVRLGISK